MFEFIGYDSASLADSLSNMAVVILGMAAGFVFGWVVAVGIVRAHRRRRARRAFMERQISWRNTQAEWINREIRKGGEHGRKHHEGE